MLRYQRLKRTLCPHDYHACKAYKRRQARARQVLIVHPAGRKTDYGLSRSPSTSAALHPKVSTGLHLLSLRWTCRFCVLRPKVLVHNAGVEKGAGGRTEISLRRRAPAARRRPTTVLRWQEDLLIGAPPPPWRFPRCALAALHPTRRRPTTVGH